MRFDSVHATIGIPTRRGPGSALAAVVAAVLLGAAGVRWMIAAIPPGVPPPPPITLRDVCRGTWQDLSALDEAAFRDRLDRLDPAALDWCESSDLPAVARYRAILERERPIEPVPEPPPRGNLPFVGVGALALVAGLALRRRRWVEIDADGLQVGRERFPWWSVVRVRWSGSRLEVTTPNRSLLVDGLDLASWEADELQALSERLRAGGPADPEAIARSVGCWAPATDQGAPGAATSSLVSVGVRDDHARATMAPVHHSKSRPSASPSGKNAMYDIAW